MAASSHPSISSNKQTTTRQRSSSNEIATFSRLASASFSDEGCDEDNSSIITVHEEFYDEQLKDDDSVVMRRSLVEYCDLRRCGTVSTGESCGCVDDEENGAEGTRDVAIGDEERRSLFSPAGASECAHSLVQDAIIELVKSPHECCLPGSRSRLGGAPQVGITNRNDMMQGPCQLLMARARNKPVLSLAAILIGICSIYLMTAEQYQSIKIFRTRNYFISKFGVAKKKTEQFHLNYRHHERIMKYPPFPAEALLGIAMNTTAESTFVDPPYDPSDFYYQNKAGMKLTLTYWEEVVAAIEEFQANGNRREKSSDGSSVVTPWTNIMSWGPCFPRALPVTDDNIRSLKTTKKKQLISHNWTYIVQNNQGIDTNDDTIQYPTYRHSFTSTEENDLGGLCRPSFLVIGQGKCGTSSLYKYLTGHERVLPAVQKQIHYFIFNVRKSLKWYYSNFPTIESFLGTGSLMTGEASPGYMPYPSVIELLVQRLSPIQPHTTSTSGLEAYKDSIQSLPKIITVVRDPIERAVSSYKYNYIFPALARLKRGQGVTASGEPIPGGKSEQFYKNNHLYTFEELASAELVTLKECLQPGGKGETYSYDLYGKSENMFFFGTFLARANRSQTPLIHLDGACYEATKSKSVPRVQWNELARRNQDKILDIPDLHLIQSIVGRSIYVLPLEWWYEVFASVSGTNEDWIHSVCTEEMGDNPADAMDDVSSFLGLPDFDFRNVTSVGWYNVDGHRGYETVTEVDEESDEDIEHSTILSSEIDLTAISDELMTELMEFYRPYNERLFELIGKRCPWKE